MSDTKFRALKGCKGAMERLEFFASSDPKCPHCGDECSVSDNEWWKLYEEGEHDVTCPSCDEDFTVRTSVSYSFSTDEQEDYEDDEESSNAS